MIFWKISEWVGGHNRAVYSYSRLLQAMTSEIQLSIHFLNQVHFSQDLIRRVVSEWLPMKGSSRTAQVAYCSELMYTKCTRCKDTKYKKQRNQVYFIHKLKDTIYQVKETKYEVPSTKHQVPLSKDTKIKCCSMYPTLQPKAVIQ